MRLRREDTEFVLAGSRSDVLRQQNTSLPEGKRPAFLFPQNSKTPVECGHGRPAKMHWGVKKRRKMMKYFLSEASLVYPAFMTIL